MGFNTFEASEMIVIYYKKRGDKMNVIKTILDIVEIFTGAPDGSTYRGFQRLTGDKSYLLAVKEEKLICWHYDTKGGELSIEKYLGSIEIDFNDIKLVHKKNLKDLELEEFYKKKLVVYNGKIHLYEDVYKKVDGVEYPPKEGINKY